MDNGEEMKATMLNKKEVRSKSIAYYQLFQKFYLQSND